VGCLMLQDGAHVGIVKSDFEGRRGYNNVSVGIDADVLRARPTDTKSRTGSEDVADVLNQGPVLARLKPFSGLG
jgi:hypothetical protein